MSRPSATERIDRAWQAMEIIRDDGQAGRNPAGPWTFDQVIQIAQVGATLAVAEAILEQTNEMTGGADR